MTAIMTPSVIRFPADRACVAESAGREPHAIRDSGSIVPVNWFFRLMVCSLTTPVRNHMRRRKCTRMRRRAKKR